MRERSRLRWPAIEPYYIRLSSIEFFVNCALMCCLSYQVAYLYSIGISVEAIGIINAVNALIGAVGALFWGFMADKLGSTKRVFLTCLVTAAVLYVATPLLGLVAIVMVALSILLGNFFRAPAFLGLADTMVLEEAQKSKLNFGSIRMWGTVGYVLMGFVLHWLANVFGIVVGFYAFGLMALITVVLVVTAVKDGAGAQAERRPVPLREMKLGRLFKSYYYVVYLVYVFLTGLCTQTSMTILPYFVEDIGLPVAIMATVGAVQAVLEIPLLLYSKQLHQQASLPVLVMGHGVFHTLRFVLLTQVHSYVALILVSLLQGISLGIEYGCSTNYVYLLAPEGLKTTAYMLKGFVGSAAGIVANLASGFLVTALGVRNLYYMISGVMGVGLLFFVCAQLFGERWFKQPLPQSVKRQRLHMR